MSVSSHNSTLARRSLTSAAWTIAGFGIAQVLRLANNLILTRFLAPDDFGLTAIITAFLIGLAMLSDFGIGPSIIQSTRGNSRDFKNTAWSIQVARGGVIWMVCAFAAWPLSIFYHQPMLAWLIPVAGFTAVINGFNPTSIFTLNRELNFKKVVFNEVLSQTMSMVLMIGLALLYPSVWILVIGTLLTALINLVLCQNLDPTHKDAFFWDKSAALEIIHYGKWIFLSSICNFIYNYGGSLLLGKFLSISMLGLFSIGFNLAKVVDEVLNRVSVKVVQPIIVHIREHPLIEIRRRIFKMRIALMIVFLPSLWFLAAFSELITSLLFDNRYQGAAWILKIFSIGYIPTAISGLGGFYYALGDSKKGFYINLLKTAFYFLSIAFGGYFFGNMGMIVGIAGSNLINYFLDVWAQRVYKIWFPMLDLAGFCMSAIVIFFII